MVLDGEKRSSETAWRIFHFTFNLLSQNLARQPGVAACKGYFMHQYGGIVIEENALKKKKKYPCQDEDIFFAFLKLTIPPLSLK